MTDKAIERCASLYALGIRTRDGGHACQGEVLLTCSGADKVIRQLKRLAKLESAAAFKRAASIPAAPQEQQ